MKKIKLLSVILALILVSSISISLGVILRSSTSETQRQDYENASALLLKSFNEDKMRLDRQLASLVKGLEAQAEEDRLILEEHRSKLKTAINNAVKSLEGSQDKILQKDNRENLQSLATAAEDHLHKIDDPTEANGTIEKIEDTIKKVDEDVKAWEAEQKRLEEERARKAAEEARRQQQATQQQTQTGQSQTTPTKQDTTSPTSNKEVPPPPKGSGGLESRVRSVMAKHCPASTKLIFDDPRLGSWANGKADWYNNTILIRSSMPSSRVVYVTAHECAHIRQYNVYGGDVNALQRDMNRIYGGSGFSGLEQNADCMTRSWGYSIPNTYTADCSGQRGKVGRDMVSGKRP